jgi:DNA repair protein RadC
LTARRSIRASSSSTRWTLTQRRQIFFHNHLSGVAEPSHTDEALTRRLNEALALIDVRVLDHFVVSTGESGSFTERGLL